MTTWYVKVGILNSKYWTHHAGRVTASGVHHAARGAILDAKAKLKKGTHITEVSVYLTRLPALPATKEGVAHA